MKATVRCTRCALSTHWPGTRLDAAGVCNYCRFYDTIGPQLRDFDRWGRVFRERIALYRGKYEYDAVVGFSGGKDSTYVIHMLQKQYGLRVLAVTLEFSFMPTTEVARANMHHTAKAMGVEHIVAHPPDEVFIPAFRRAMRRQGVPCALCTELCLSFVGQVAQERRIPLAIDGLDRAQLFRSMAPGPGSAWTFDDLRLAYASLSQWHEGLPARRMKDYRDHLAMYGFFGLSEKDCAAVLSPPEPIPETGDWWQPLRYFLYHPYDEKAIKRTLREEIGWQDPSGDRVHSHHDCALCDGLAHYKRRFLGVCETEGETAVSVREGTLTRSEAQRVVQAQHARLDAMEHPYVSLQGYLGLSEREIERVGRAAGRRLRFLSGVGALANAVHPPKRPALFGPSP